MIISVTNSKGLICPTQLAAIKVDKNWNIQRTFYSRIKPLNYSFEIKNIWLIQAVLWKIIYEWIINVEVWHN